MRSQGLETHEITNQRPAEEVSPKLRDEGIVEYAMPVAMYHEAPSSASAGNR